MKQIIRLLLLACVALGLKSCYNVDGDCVGERVPVTEFTFDAKGGSQVIEYDSYIGNASSFYVDGELYQWVQDSCDMSNTLAAPCFSYEAATGISQLRGAWFTLQQEHGDINHLTLLVAPNATGKNREISWLMDVRNCFVYLAITQSAE